ncbi:MAG TPA: WXG100 family type VII secretion target [Mycobacteriales bacterium]|nr:WXG100 family type VII secretion target [Mycobacteriales bacterium]
MPAAGETIGVVFGSLQDGASGLAASLTAIRSSLDDLKARVESNLANWDGDARATYFAAKARWEADAVALADILNRMAVHVGESHDGYSVTESRNASMFG